MFGNRCGLQESLQIHVNSFLCWNDILFWLFNHVLEYASGWPQMASANQCWCLLSETDVFLHILCNKQVFRIGRQTHLLYHRCPARHYAQKTIRLDWFVFFSPVPSPRVISNLLCFHVMFEMFKLHSSHHDKMFSRSSTSLKINKKLFPESSKGVKLMPHNHQNRPFRAEIWYPWRVQVDISVFQFCTGRPWRNSDVCYSPNWSCKLERV